LVKGLKFLSFIVRSLFEPICQLFLKIDSICSEVSLVLLGCSCRALALMEWRLLLVSRGLIRIMRMVSVAGRISLGSGLMSNYWFLISRRNYLSLACRKCHRFSISIRLLLSSIVGCIEWVVEREIKVSLNLLFLGHDLVKLKRILLWSILLASFLTFLRQLTDFF
jgi:hypothetical protein